MYFSNGPRRTSDYHALDSRFGRIVVDYWAGLERIGGCMVQPPQYDYCIGLAIDRPVFLMKLSETEVWLSSRARGCLGRRLFAFRQAR